MSITIEKHWDGNECETEGANGRTYVSRGRWQWLVIVDGETDSAHDRKREAVARVAFLTGEARRAAAAPPEVRFDRKSTAERIARAAWTGATVPAPATSDECPLCSTVGAGPLCKMHRTLTIEEKITIERARTARTAVEWAALPVRTCVSCGQRFKQEHHDQLVCRDSMGSEAGAFTFYPIDEAERATWNAEEPITMATPLGPVDVSAYTPEAYGSRGDGPEVDVEPAPVAPRLRALETQARALLLALGELSGEYDSARLGAALGHVSSAVAELSQAASVREAIERHEDAGDVSQCGRCGGIGHITSLCKKVR